MVDGQRTVEAESRKVRVSSPSTVVAGAMASEGGAATCCIYESVRRRESISDTSWPVGPGA